jgi:hypothetical protein
MKRVALFVLILILASVASQAKIHSSDWKSGVLKRVAKEHLTQQSGQLGKKPPKHGVFISYYFVEADNSLYEGDDVTLKKNEKGFPVSVNSPVQFFVAGTQMYLRDNRGKSHRLRLVNVLPAGAAASPQTSSTKSPQ